MEGADWEGGVSLTRAMVGKDDEQQLLRTGTAVTPAAAAAASSSGYGALRLAAPAPPTGQAQRGVTDNFDEEAEVEAGQRTLLGGENGTGAGTGAGARNDATGGVTRKEARGMITRPP